MYKSASMRRFYLNHNKRYEILVVKAAERPHLLCWTASLSYLSLAKQDEEKSLVFDHNITKEEKNVEEEEEGEFSSAASSSSLISPPPPLTDGTGLPVCRNGNVNTSHHVRTAVIIVVGVFVLPDATLMTATTALERGHQ